MVFIPFKGAKNKVTKLYINGMLNQKGYDYKLSNTGIQVPGNFSSDERIIVESSEVFVPFKYQKDKRLEN